MGGGGGVVILRYWPSGRYPWIYWGAFSGRYGGVLIL